MELDPARVRTFFRRPAFAGNAEGAALLSRVQDIRGADIARSYERTR
jgi:hypothetical protein